MGDYICECGESFDSAVSLVQHMEATGHHEDDFPEGEFECIYCDRVFDSMVACEQHMSQGPH